MAITSILRNFDGEPNFVYIVTTDDLTTITTAGYVTAQEANIELLNNGEFQWAITDIVVIAYSPDLVGFFTFDSTTEAFVSLTANGGLSSTLPAGDIFVGNASNIATGVTMSGDATIDDTGALTIANGAITNAKVNASAAIAFSKLAALPAADILVGSASNVATAVTMSGDATISDTGVLTLDPTLQLGASGTASSLTLYPATAANGYLEILPVNAGADNHTIISNGVMGQDTTYTIPDIGASTGDIVVSTGAVRMKAVDAAVAAGGAATQSISDAFCTSTSVVLGSWVTQTNAEEIVKIVPGNGSFVITSTGDVGAGTFSYVILK
jgi:hypothetical protein